VRGGSRAPSFGACALALNRWGARGTGCAVRNLWSAALALAVTAAAPRADADVSSWLAVGAGYALQRDRHAGENQYAPALTYSMGVGTSPLQPYVLGGLVRGTTFLGYGTDLGLGLRAATGGFARGDWGAALEADALWRPWRSGDFGQWPLQAAVTVGSPWGFQVSLGADFASVSGQRSAVGGFVVLELDLLRLTVTRQGATEHWWYNPAPAGGHLPDRDHPAAPEPAAPAARSGD
jgi:hypothetical protein